MNEYAPPFGVPPSGYPGLKRDRGIYGPVTYSTRPDAVGTVRDFVLYCCQDLAEENVFIGYENAAVLPPLSDEYAVITLAGETGRGTTMTRYVPSVTEEGQGVQVFARLTECAVRVDFFSAGDEGANRAAAAETVFSSSAGAAFFNELGFGCLYSEGVEGAENTDASGKYVKKYSVTLRLSCVYETGVETPCFSAVRFEGAKSCR